MESSSLTSSRLCINSCNINSYYYRTTKPSLRHPPEAIEGPLAWSRQSSRIKGPANRMSRLRRPGNISIAASHPKEESSTKIDSTMN